MGDTLRPWEFLRGRQALWDPALGMLIDALSGKTGVSEPVPGVADPHSCFPCDSLHLQDDPGVATHGEMGPLGRRKSGAR